MKIGYSFDLDYENQKVKIFYDPGASIGFMWPKEIKFEFGVDEEEECFKKLEELEFDPESQEFDAVCWFFRDLRDADKSKTTD